MYVVWKSHSWSQKSQPSCSADASASKRRVGCTGKRGEKWSSSMPRSLSSPSAQMRNWEHGAVKNTSSTLATATHLLVELTFSFFSLQRQGQCLTSPRLYSKLAKNMLKLRIFTGSSLKIRLFKDIQDSHCHVILTAHPFDRSFLWGLHGVALKFCQQKLSTIVVWRYFLEIKEIERLVKNVHFLLSETLVFAANFLLYQLAVHHGQKCWSRNFDLMIQMTGRSGDHQVCWGALKTKFLPVAVVILWANVVNYTDWETDRLSLKFVNGSVFFRKYDLKYF